MVEWDKISIKIDDNNIVNASAPLIISASRSTDIPAFYTKWFFNRLEKGYLTWTNPFNQKPQYISLNRLRFVVFWTKNPQPMIPYLKELDKRGIGYYFQYTLNDYFNEGLEPNVPSLINRIETFILLSNKIGKHKTIWRFDPLLLSDKLTLEQILLKIENIGDKINKHTEKLVFSFADIQAYRKVINNLRKNECTYREFHKEEMQEIAKQLNLINKRWNLTLATCAEEINLEEFGIGRNRCVDDELIIRINSNDKILNELIHRDVEPPCLFKTEFSSSTRLKDRGQRKLCGCIISKDIGMYNTCNHLCMYCYANNSPELVRKNFRDHNDDNPSII